MRCQDATGARLGDREHGQEERGTGKGKLDGEGIETRVERVFEEKVEEGVGSWQLGEPTATKHVA